MRILIIEDDEKLARSLQNYLVNKGYAVDIIHDGEAGRKRIEAYGKDYDMVILDWILPRQDGIEICKSIRSRNIHVPILMLTGKDAVEDKIFGLENGADDYLTKPFSCDELLARMKALARRPKVSLPNKLQARNIILDPAAGKVLIGGKEINLTLREFRILEYFMRNPNRVLNREQILDNNWDFENNSFSNVIDVHVNHLRRKISKGGGAGIIKTIRGIGYMLSSEYLNP